MESGGAPISANLLATELAGLDADSLLAQHSDNEISMWGICHDTLGRPVHATDSIPVVRCTPCTTYRIQSSPELAAAHARRLWLQGARAPYDQYEMGPACARRAYRIALSFQPDDDSLAIELSLVSLASSVHALRANALRMVDSLVEQRISDRRRTQASRMLAQFGLGIWDRAQRELERPVRIDVSPQEKLAHQLAYGSPPMSQLPPIPETSPGLGVSEAMWSARIFDAAAQFATSPGDRSRLMRLALAPWVVLENWHALDSAARTYLQRFPGDSAVLPARALAAYRTMSHPVYSGPAVMALFDTALVHSPRVDSLRMDSFDPVLQADDEAWRERVFPDQRATLDRRGWLLIDPLWSTPVNEIQLALRARTVEADYRYADIAGKGEAGSETRAGQVLIRRGPPAAQWTIDAVQSGRLWAHRSWQGLRANAELEARRPAQFGSASFARPSDQTPQGRDNWRIFYGTSFTPSRALLFTPERSCTFQPEPFLTLFKCAVGMRPEFHDVPFFERTDDIDVTIARFRGAKDSSDTYISARIPLRGFRSRADRMATSSDRIGIGVWLTTELGAPIFHESESRELPDANTIAWTRQWTHRMGSTRAMHRVEAIEARAPAGARGVARFTSDSLVSFPLSGFGMSDVLVASSAAKGAGTPRRWSDLVVAPNGAAVAPGERFAMVWETYDLARGSDGRVHWRVRIKRELGRTVAQYGMQQVLTSAANAGSRVVADESTAPHMSYERSEVASAVVLDNVMFGLNDFPPGQHVVNVTIDDLVSGQSVTRGVSVRVVAPESQKRGTKIRTPAR